MFVGIVGCDPDVVGVGVITGGVAVPHVPS